MIEGIEAFLSVAARIVDAIGLLPIPIRTRKPARKIAKVPAVVAPKKDEKANPKLDIV